MVAKLETYCMYGRSQLCMHRKPCSCVEKEESHVKKEAGGPRVGKAPVGPVGWAVALVSVGSDSSR